MGHFFQRIDGSFLSSSLLFALVARYCIHNTIQTSTITCMYQMSKYQLIVKVRVTHEVAPPSLQFRSALVENLTRVSSTMAELAPPHHVIIPSWQIPSTILSLSTKHTWVTRAALLSFPLVDVDVPRTMCRFYTLLSTETMTLFRCRHQDGINVKVVHSVHS